ncbi:sperm-associated microtubule inner protein 10-like [Ruditapes philippinarum]|uniref:sperm-associated microtubule inner protein 10-like n=1 Tax=Ruditapes philippinarum TaxID=129788 RepID=UPI00295AB3C2|nr:sperm-associated microtubule inner protein 10-like [Ruditapes philippinarum]
MAAKQSVDPRFAERLFVHSQTRIPQYSRTHGQVPRLYTQEWKTDMKNRELIIKNAELGGVPHYEHDENLFLDKREQMHYNVENRNRVDRKCKMPDRELLLRPPFHHETSRYQSELMFRRDM